MTQRPTFNRLVLLLALSGGLGLLGILGVLPVSGARAQSTTTSTTTATTSTASAGGTVIICEATGNPNAPYVEVDVPRSDLGNFGPAEGDIVPAPPGGCPHSAGGTTGTTGPTKPKHKPRPKHGGGHPTPVAPAPAAAPTPASSSPAAASSAPETAASEGNSAVPAASVHALPTTGGHTLVTIVLGLLLLYCGGVIRWAAAGPETAAPRRLRGPRRG